RGHGDPWSNRFNSCSSTHCHVEPRPAWRSRALVAFKLQHNFTMLPRNRRIILSIASIFLLLVLIFVIWFDWNMVKPYVERQVTEKTGREFLIRGNLDVDLSLNPLISADGISLANADWGTEQPMLSVDRLAFRIS